MKAKKTYDEKIIQNISISTKQLFDIYSSLSYLSFESKEEDEELNFSFYPNSFLKPGVPLYFAPGPHEWGKDKYSGLGKQYGYDGAAGILEPDSEVVKKCREILESHGLEVVVGK